MNAAVLVVLLALVSPVAAPKTDIVVLANGDRITCEVVQMRQAKLTVKTDDAGTLSIEWTKITSVTTAAEFDVTLRSGVRLLGRLAPGPARVVHVVAASGTVTPASIDDIVSFVSIKSAFFDRIDGSVDLGGSYTQSSGVADLYFDASATYRRPAYAFSVSFSTNLTRQPDAPETSRYVLKPGYTRSRGKWFVSTFGLFEGNRELGFSFRGTGAGTVGHYLARSNHVEFLLAAGLAAGRETPVDSGAVTNIDSLIAADLSVFAYDYPTTRLDIGLLVFPSLDDPGRVRVNASAKFKQEIFHDFFVAVSAYDAFDNRPKSAGARTNDVGGSLSFGWSF